MKIAARLALLQWSGNPADPAALWRLVIAWITPGMREPQAKNEPRTSAAPNVKSSAELLSDAADRGEKMRIVRANIRFQRPARRAWERDNPNGTNIRSQRAARRAWERDNKNASPPEKPREAAGHRGNGGNGGATVPREMSKATTKLLYSSETIGCGATLELGSKETCLISVAQTGVRVKAYRRGGRFGQFWIGLFGAIIYEERNVYKAAKTAAALDALFPKRAVPVAFRNPVLAAFTNAVWQCSSAAEVAVTLNEAVIQD
jgi:hypothetical protein